MTLYTIGHSSHTTKRFIDLLEAHKINILADIRSFPGSKAHPHFGRERLSKDLSQAGIEYVWIPRLGGRRHKVRADSPNGGLTHPAFRSYADYMMSDEFADGVEELFGAMARGRTAVCCSEGWHVKCHRRLLSDYLVAVQSVKVNHIASCVRAYEHEVQKNIRRVANLIVYP